MTRYDCLNCSHPAELHDAVGCTWPDHQAGHDHDDACRCRVTGRELHEDTASATRGPPPPETSPGREALGEAARTEAARVYTTTAPEHRQATPTPPREHHQNRR